MSLTDGIRQLMERMQPADLQAVANDALVQELQVLLDEIQAQRQTMDRVRNFQEVQRRVEAKRGERMACGGEGFDGLITELEKGKAEVSARVDRLLGQRPVEERGGEEGGEESAHRLSAGSVVSVSDDDVDVEVTDLNTQSSAVAPVPVAEVPSATANPIVEETSPSCVRAPTDTQSSQPGEAPPVDDKRAGAAVNNGSNAANKRAKTSTGSSRPTATNVRTQPPSSISPPSAHAVSSAAQVRPDDIPIDTNNLAGFTLSSLMRCEQLCLRGGITATERGELFGRVPTLIVAVSKSRCPQDWLMPLTRTIDRVILIVVRSVLTRQERFHFVCAIRAALIVCQYAELTALAARLGTAVLATIFPLGFVGRAQSPLFFMKTSGALDYFQCCGRNRDYNRAVVRAGLEYLEHSLSQPWSRCQHGVLPTIVPLPLLFVDLFIVIHLTMKQAPLGEAYELVNWMSRIKDKYDGEDDLIEIYQRMLLESCKRRSAGDTSDRNKLFSFDAEMRLIQDKLQWYLRRQGVQ